MLSPGAGWPAKIKTQVTLGRPCQVQSPPSLGLSRPLTFIKSVQELRILGGAGGTGNEGKGSALWPWKPRGARELEATGSQGARPGLVGAQQVGPQGRVCSQRGITHLPRSGKTEEPVPGRPGGTSGAHLSFTSSFTPELAWRAWFIMSYSRQQEL